MLRFLARCDAFRWASTGRFTAPASITRERCLIRRKTGRYTTTPDGKLRNAPNVYVADGSSWRFMPAKGLTLTLMANARRVAAQAVRDLAAEDASSR